MNEFPFEDLLAPFYKELYAEYMSESEDYHLMLYNKYVDPQYSKGLFNMTVNCFPTYPCKPKDWLFPIGLFVNVYMEIRFYFTSAVDLRPYVSMLVKDNNFKELIKVGFYLKETICPKFS